MQDLRGALNWWGLMFCSARISMAQLKLPLMLLSVLGSVSVANSLFQVIPVTMPIENLALPTVVHLGSQTCNTCSRGRTLLMLVIISQLARCRQHAHLLVVVVSMRRVRMEELFVRV